MFCRDGNHKTYEVHKMLGVSGPIDWILYLQRRKHPTPKRLPSTLGRQRTQGNKQSLFEWILLRMYTKQKMREQKKNMLWIAICISPQNRKLISMLAYIVIAEVTFFNWKKQTKVILGIILLCQFIEWHTEYRGSKMFFLWSVVVKELTTRANCLWLWMSEEIVLIQRVSYEHLRSVYGLKGIDVATAALLENSFNFQLINTKGKKKEYIKLGIND